MTLCIYKDINMRPMLAYTWDESQPLAYPKYMSPKIDGIRGLVVNGCVMSRSFKPIPNRHIQKKFGKFQNNGLDGEFTVGSMGYNSAYRKTVSSVMSEDKDDEFCFNVFDDFLDPNLPFSERLRNAGDRCGGNICFVPHKFVYSLEELLQYEQECVELGFEGIMGRCPNSPYKFGRSTPKEQSLFKVKRFEDDEAIVLEVTQYLKNENISVVNELGLLEKSGKQDNLVPQEKVGSLIVKNRQWITFSIGSGLTQEERELYWKDPSLIIGKLIKYKHQSHSDYDKPRQPVYLGIRHEHDL